MENKQSDMRLDGPVTVSNTLGGDDGTLQIRTVYLTQISPYDASTTGPITLSGGTISIGGMSITGNTLNLDTTNKLYIDSTDGLLKTQNASRTYTLTPVLAKGQFITNNGTSNVAFPLGLNNYFLQVDTTAATGLKWASANYQYKALGDLLVGTGAGTASILPVGSTNQFLMADTNAAAGFSYQPASTIISQIFSPAGTQGQLIVSTGGTGFTTLARGTTNGQMIRVNAATSAGIEYFTPTYADYTILQNKGDLFSRPATSNVIRQPIGSDGQVLTANSASATGLSWLPAAAALGYQFASQTTTVTNTSRTTYVTILSITITMEVGTYLIFYTYQNATAATSSFYVRLRDVTSGAILKTETEVSSGTETPTTTSFVFYKSTAIQTRQFILEFVNATNGTYRVSNANILSQLMVSGVTAASNAIIQPWASGTAYIVNNQVTYNGLTYYCTTAHTSTATNTPDVSTTLWIPL